MTDQADVVGSGSHDYTATYDPDTDFDAWYTRATAALIAPQIRPGQHVLELGCATGLMTSLLASTGANFVGVERSAGYLDRAAARNLPRTEWIQADLAEFTSEGGFDNILATNLLHGFDDPTWLLRRIAGWLSAGGLLHVTLPNPDSLNILVALADGLMTDSLALSDRARMYGTRRAWPAAAFRDLARDNGFEVVATGGVSLKPYPNATMARLPEHVLDGLARAAAILPDNAAMHYTALARAGGRS